MNDNGTAPRNRAPLARRTNGLAPEAPEPGQLVLVTGGAGYIGSALGKRLLDRGYRVRILDRLYWGRAPIGRAVIGGLLFASVGTLIIVPVTYSLIRKEAPVDYAARLEREIHSQNPQTTT